MFSVEQWWCCEHRPWDRTPGRFPSARLPPSRGSALEERQGREDGHRAFLSQPHPAGATCWPGLPMSLYTPGSSLFTERACWEIHHQPESVWLGLVCLVTPRSQWGIHQGHRHSVCFGNCECLFQQTNGLITKISNNATYIANGRESDATVWETALKTKYKEIILGNTYCTHFLWYFDCLVRFLLLFNGSLIRKLWLFLLNEK